MLEILSPFFLHGLGGDDGKIEGAEHGCGVKQRALFFFQEMSDERMKEF